MIPNWNEYCAAEEHRADLLREAARRSLIHQTFPAAPARGAGIRRLIVELGRLLGRRGGRRAQPEADARSTEGEVVARESR